MTAWDEAKRPSNIESHKLDFAGCDAIWDNFTITREDVRQAYGKKRLVTYDMLARAKVNKGGRPQTPPAVASIHKAAKR